MALTEAQLRAVIVATLSEMDRTGNLTGADKQYGYRFGCDGLMSLAQTREFLGSISNDTLYRKIKAGLIRKGNHPGGGRAVVCRRSVMEYIATLEN